MAFSKHKDENIGFFVIDYSAGGGVERVTANLMCRFREEGFQNLNLISLKSGSGTPSMNYPKNASLKIFDKENTGKKFFADELAEYLKKKNIQHLIFQGDNMTIALEVLKAATTAGCHAYPQYHGSPYAYLRKYSEADEPNIEKIIFSKIVYPFKKKKLKKFIENSAQGIFCVSKGSADELKQIFKDDTSIAEKLKVIRNPILLKEQHEVGKEKVITFVSRLENKHKNAFLAVKAWSLIANKYPDWKLVILGDGSLKGKIEEFCKKQNLRNIELPGFVSNVNEILAKSSISLNVSNCEGFPMGVAEAIVQKNVLVVTDSDGGAKDMIIHGKTGLISPKNDAEKLALNLEKTINDENLRRELSENAFNHLKKIAKEDSFEMWMKELFMDESVLQGN